MLDSRSFTAEAMANPRIEPLRKFLALEPNDEVAWFGLGKAYMEDANFTEAVTALEQCIRVKPTYSAAYYALAQSLYKLGRFEDCVRISDRGIEESTKNGDAMVTKNLSLLKDSLPHRT
jgi:tetratricopeptide (TPR) repeat protein